MNGVGVNSYDMLCTNGINSVLSDETNRVINYANTGIWEPVRRCNCNSNPVNTESGIPISNSYNSNYINGRVRVEQIMANPRELKKLEMIADTINESFNTFSPNNTEELKDVFSKLTPEKAAVLEKIYGAKYGAPDQLRKDLKSNLGCIGDDYSKSGMGSWKNSTPWAAAAAGFTTAAKTKGLGKTLGLIVGVAGGLLGIANSFNNRAEFSLGDAMKKLNDGAKYDPEVASIALRNSMEGTGTDEQTVNDILLSSNTSDEFVMATMESYEAMFGTSLQKDIKDDFSYYTGAEQPYISRLNKAITSDDYTYYSNYGPSRYNGIG